MKSQIDQFRDKMLRENLPPLVIDTFAYYYNLLLEGNTGCIPEHDILPIGRNDLARASDLAEFCEHGKAALGRAAILKLNGGLGTTMGLKGPKSLLKIRGERNFIDLVLGQRNRLNEEFGCSVPVLFMNSFNTDAPTVAYLKMAGAREESLPLTFLQHKYPKLLAATLAPALWPANPKLEWNPPGHGNIYTALVTTGLLDRLRSGGIRYLFISNVDNLGAWLDVTLLGYFAHRKIPFMMEVVQRTAMDRKGGHLARRGNGLVLRELAQVSKDDIGQFQDIERYCFFNTNNIWLDLDQISAVLEKSRGVLPLPLIRNEKNLDPRDPASPRVYQIETAMGAAISLFEGSELVATDRVRYSPVKRSEELLVAWSDYYLLGEDFSFSFNPKRTLAPITVQLDPAHFGTCDKMLERFPHAAPSLVDCASLSIEGDVRFGANVTIRGRVRITNRSDAPAVIADGTVIEGDMDF